MDHEELRERYTVLQKQLAQVGYICNGTVMSVFRKCGKPNCGCKDDPKMQHGPYHIWTRKEKGKTIRNSDHIRDKQKSIKRMIPQVTELFTDKQKAETFLEKIYADKPRYIRDQLQVIKKVVDDSGVNVAELALNFCMENEIFSASDFRDIALIFFNRKTEKEPGRKSVADDQEIILNQPASHLINTVPDKSQIKTYENIIANH